MDQCLRGRLLRARSGDRRAREDILEDYAAFARAAAHRVVGHYVGSEDDLASIALMGLDEAIDSCGEEQLSRGFFGFAEMVIRRRVIDQLRRERRFGREIPLGAFGAEGEGEAPLPIVAGSMKRSRMEEEAAILREEIGRLEKTLDRFGISFADLPRLSPSRSDARRRCLAAARDLLDSGTDMSDFFRTGRLPLVRMQDRVLGRKALERHRGYLVTLLTVLSGDFPALGEYLDSREEE